MAGHGNSIVLFNDGEEVVQGDFNAVQNCLTERAWEIPGYHDLAAFDQFASTYETAFIYGPGNGRKSGVFTKGGGLCPSYDGPTGRTSSLSGGLLGIWSTPLDGTPPVDSTAARAMRWVSLWGGEWSYLHDATATGQYRVDIVTCKIDEAAAVPTSRSFQDAVTGALTTWTGDKQTVLTLDLSSTTAVTKGTEAASEAAATIPAIPTGRRLLYYVVVHGTAITSIHDCTIPAQSLQSGIIFSVQGYLKSASWTESNFHITSTTSVSTVLLPPPAISGDPSVRVLGLQVAATLHGADSVRLCTYDWQTDTAPMNGLDLSGLFARSGAPETTTIDLRGKPSATGVGPVWMNGLTTKQDGTTTTLALYVNSSASGTVLKSVKWYTIRG